MGGSPPRVRELLSEEKRAYATAGITPACAGITVPRLETALID